MHKFFRGLVDGNPGGKRKTKLDEKQRTVAPSRPLALSHLLPHARVLGRV